MLAKRGFMAPAIARLLRADVKDVRRVIHRWNADGPSSLWPVYRGGGRVKFDADTRQKIVQIGKKSPPARMGLSRWSLRKLRSHLVETKILREISLDTLRDILFAGGVSFQRTKTWKKSDDPEFYEKLRRVRRLARRKPRNGVVFSFDEFGPIAIKPYAGSSWSPRKKPKRLRATYKRTQGVLQVLAAIDLHTDKRMHVSVGRRKRWKETLAFFRRLRRLHPLDVRLYIIMDNFSPHKKQEVCDWAAANNVVFAFTPSNASHLNPIECHFAPLREFAINGTDHGTASATADAIRDYVRWRNAHLRDRNPGVAKKVA